MPMIYDEPQVFALLSVSSGHTHQDITMAATLPDEEDDEDEDEDDIEDEDEEDEEDDDEEDQEL